MCRAGASLWDAVKMAQCHPPCVAPQLRRSGAGCPAPARTPPVIVLWPPAVSASRGHGALTTTAPSCSPAALVPATALRPGRTHRRSGGGGPWIAASASSSAAQTGGEDRSSRQPNSDSSYDASDDSIQAELARQWRELRAMLRGQPPDDVLQRAPDNQEAAGSSSSTTTSADQQQEQTQAQGEGSGEAGEDADRGPFRIPAYRWPWVTWAMCAWAWLVLLQQWLPLLAPLLTEPGAAAAAFSDGWGALTVAAGVMLLVPGTPAARAWIMGVPDWQDGGWLMAAVGASCLYSGLLPTLVFTRAVLTAGGAVETAYGPLVLTWHVLWAAGAGAVAHMLFSPFNQTITGPALACGLTAGRAVLLALEKRRLRQRQRELGRALAALAGAEDAGRAADDAAPSPPAAPASEEQASRAVPPRRLFSWAPGGKQQQQGGAAEGEVIAAEVVESPSPSAQGEQQQQGEEEGGEEQEGGEAEARRQVEEELALLRQPVLTWPLAATWGAALLLGLFQPLLGIQGVVGGFVGGVVAALTCFPALAALRWVLVRVIRAAFWLLGWLIRLPLLAFSFVSGAVLLLARAAQDLVASFRRL